MFNQEKITFIGGGAMARAMLTGMMSNQLLAPSQVTVSEPVESLGEALIRDFGIRHTTDNQVAVQGADIVIMAVKPQYAGDVYSAVAGQIPKGALLLSIMAGEPISKIRTGLQLDAIVRVMPNTPAQVGQGISGWTATAAVSKTQRAQAKALLGALGEEIYLDKEHLLDMVTAMSGSGPAYVFLFIEAFIDAGVQLGLPRPIAQTLALQTLEGSVAFARQFPQHPAELRSMVTSPGGTTAAALYQLEKGGFRALMSRAIYAAYQKSVELGSN